MLDKLGRILPGGAFGSGFPVQRAGECCRMARTPDGASSFAAPSATSEAVWPLPCLSRVPAHGRLRCLAAMLLHQSHHCGQFAQRSRFMQGFHLPWPLPVRSPCFSSNSISAMSHLHAFIGPIKFALDGDRESSSSSAGLSVADPVIM